MLGSKDTIRLGAGCWLSTSTGGDTIFESELEAVMVRVT